MIFPQPTGTPSPFPPLSFPSLPRAGRAAIWDRRRGLSVRDGAAHTRTSPRSGGLRVGGGGGGRCSGFTGVAVGLVRAARAVRVVQWCGAASVLPQCGHSVNLTAVTRE
ncbi:hypothetical protein E2C01_056963 [Portunus trituberculatus]|uniref:Uncharacterized protein n=1 Tax=Portunus trituberculatus TaxID=210409 RepID=A0A5B7GYT0_PORTR|nr:hypothetical protein [Portunus trituberculatus]